MTGVEVGGGRLRRGPRGSPTPASGATDGVGPREEPQEMTSSFERSQDRATTAPVDLQGIEAGWTVYDSLGRPVGNVTDVAGDLLRIDVRPEGFDFFEVPT